MTKHTPGPWRVARHATAKKARLQIWQDKSGQHMGEFKIADDVTFPADAALIAAAPDMEKVVRSLANIACHSDLVEAIVGLFRDHEKDDVRAMLADARAAIAKIEGRSA